MRQMIDAGFDRHISSCLARIIVRLLLFPKGSVCNAAKESKAED
jgi:hypothetical protein